MGSVGRSRVGCVQKKTWARIDDGSPGNSELLDEQRWIQHWAFGTGSSPGGLGLSSVDFWGLTPREFQALASIWERDREFQVSLCARIDATLRNTALDMAFKPPEGKWWTPQMLMPGYQAESTHDTPWDWKAEKAKMQLINKRLDPVKRRTDAEARKSTHDRFRMAEAAKQRGATSEEIRLILEA
jgi:hypothetical protein